MMRRYIQCRANFFGPLRAWKRRSKDKRRTEMCERQYATYLQDSRVERLEKMYGENRSMGKSALLVIVDVFLAMAFFAAVIPTFGRIGELDSLIGRADAIVVIEIVSTDYTRTAADGPMYAEAKVLKVLKGNIPKWRRLRFGETAWWSPAYRDGEHRIIFLNRVTSKDKHYRAKWHTTYASGVDFFLLEDALEDISQASLLDFLKEIEGAGTTPPKLEFNITQKDAITWTLSVDIVNETNQAFWLNPSKIAVSLDAHQTRYSCELDWSSNKEDAWVKIGPTFRISGLIPIRDEELKEADEVKVRLSHLSACFPYRCWVGFQSADIRPRDEDDVREAVFLFQFDHNASGLQQNAKVYFLSLGGGDRDPSDEFMERFRGLKPPVKKVSECTASVTGVKDKETGEHGLIFRVTSIKWVSDSEVEVEGGYHEASESASGNTYLLLREGERWFVKEHRMNWIK